MKKYKVYFLTVAVEWEGVEAASSQEAINKCFLDPRLHFEKPVYWIAEEQEECDGI